MKNLFGVPSLKLTDAVANFMIEQGNSGQSHYPDNLVRAARSWEDLCMDTIWTIKYKAVAVNKTDNSVKLPKDKYRLISINIEDKCGMLVPVAHNQDMNTLKVDCPSKMCSCKTCGGENSFCVAMDAVSVINETIMINGFPFTKRTWTQKGDGGTLQRVTEIPYPVLPYPGSGAPQVNYREETTTLCNLEVTETNCIKQTESNRKLLVQHCGCIIAAWREEICCSDRFFPKSDYGYWNYKANCDDTIILKDVTADMVIVAYQSSGGPGEEIIIPRIALDAVQYGIVHRQRAFSPAFNRLEKREAKQDYENEKYKLSVFLHPVDLDSMEQLRSIIMLW